MRSPQSTVARLSALTAVLLVTLQCARGDAGRESPAAPYLLEPHTSVPATNWYELDESVYENHRLYDLDRSRLKANAGALALFEELPFKLESPKFTSEAEGNLLRAEIESAEIHGRLVLAYGDHAMLGSVHYDDRSFIIVRGPTGPVQVAEVKQEVLQSAGCEFRLDPTRRSPQGGIRPRPQSLTRDRTLTESSLRLIAAARVGQRDYPDNLSGTKVPW